MEIAILPGATCAVVRIKIDKYIDGYQYQTQWKILYKRHSESSYTSASGEDSINHNSDEIYGYGPIFYDLEGLDANTEYDIKLQITYPNITNNETPVKTFETCSEGNFDFESVTSTSSSTPQAFYTNVDTFKECMIAVGYNYYVTNQRASSYMYPRTDPFIISIKYGGNVSGSGASASFKGTINMGGNYNDLTTYVHEYRHVLGLAGTENHLYHGDDPCSMGFYRDWSNQKIYYQNICDIASFTRGIDDGSMEIYMFYGENSVDSKYIPRWKNSSSSRKILLGFFLLKALGLNDITIVY